jgi:DNA-directed RNA polymerase specialized sigma24 family protein
MRRRLVGYFNRRHCVSPDDLADETLNRIARVLDERGTIAGTVPGQYCYTVAKFVFLEYLRSSGQRHISLDGERLTLAASTSHGDDSTAMRERFLDALDRCLADLQRVDRELILDYYRGPQGTVIEHRRRLAVERGMTSNALMIRACRIRSRLEACVNHRIAEERV